MMMSVSLPDDLRDFVDARIASGRYASASEIVEDALRLLAQHEDDAHKLNWLRNAYRQGVESGDAGVLDVTAVMAEARQTFDAKSG
jgi:antitoxin ParD1/3/4